MQAVAEIVLNYSILLYEAVDKPLCIARPGPDLSLTGITPGSRLEFD